MVQGELAQKAGIGIATLRRIEKDGKGQMANWVKIQMTLGNDHVLDGFLPREVRSPRRQIQSSGLGSFHQKKPVGGSKSPMHIIKLAKLDLLEGDDEHSQSHVK